jgi:hypothetical protein
VQIKCKGISGPNLSEKLGEAGENEWNSRDQTEVVQSDIVELK